MKKHVSLLFLFIFTLSISSIAQNNRWKRTRYEIVGGIGVTGFMGDLGGGKVDAKYLGDFDFGAQRPLLQVGMRYKLYERIAVKSTLSYGWVSGFDNKSQNEYNLNRNLSFYSPIVELAGQLEYSITKEPVNHRYNLRRGRKFSLRNIKLNTYVFGGISGFYFNPKGKDPVTGDWVALQPLGTEGQGLMEGREKYSRISMAFPFGLGAKYNLTRSWTIGVELGARYTLTDYIDDVSTSYVDNDWLERERGEVAARLADPSAWSENPLEGFLGYGAGDQRGNPKFNDFYMFSLVTVTYKLRTGRNGLPKF